MKQTAGVLLLAVLAVSCEQQVVVPPPPNPPQVFLTVRESNVIGDAVRGQVNVSGCKKVAQVQLLQGEAFLADVNYTTSPTEFTLSPGLFASLYPRLGIAAALTLKAKVICDDARTNNSQPVGVKFFPIATRYASTVPGEQLVTDNFVAEGGLGGSRNTFLGCSPNTTGTQLVRVDTMGAVVAFNNTLPFDCSLSTQISELSLVSGTRWVLEPGAGAYAIRNDTLQITKVVRERKAARMGVGAKGSAAIWVDESGRSRVLKVDPVTSTSNDWTFPRDFITPIRLFGIMNSDPVIDDGSGAAVWVSEWRFDVGSKIATIVPFKLDLLNGALLNGVVNGQPAVIVEQQHPLDAASQPIMPEGFFTSDGAFFTMPFIALNAQTSVIYSCATAFGQCEGAARRWSSVPFPGILRKVVPYSLGNIYAAIGPYSVYFLNGQLGTVMNLGEQPLQPSGSLVVVGVQAGLGSDFYVLTGPNFGPGVTSYAMEIIATDAPASGELWRLEYGSGESSSTAMYMGVDANRQVWIRTGTDLIKPLPNIDYRNARGPTVLP